MLVIAESLMLADTVVVVNTVSDTDVVTGIVIPVVVSDVADVVIAHEGHGQRDDVQLVPLIDDQLLQSQDQKRKPKDGIDPHQIVLMNHRKGGQRIHDRKSDDYGLIGTS